MPIPSSEPRLTRNQIRLGRAGLSASSPSQESSSPCKLLASGEIESGSKTIAAGGGRRKALADLAGNDSPIVGLIPGLHNCAGRTPFPDLMSAVGAQSCTKKLVPRADDCSNTPIGESLLRSQVQLLLQKVESDAPAIQKPSPSLRALCHLHNFMESPALKLLAPTPMNTPCNSTAPSENEPTASISLIEMSDSDLSVQRLVSKPQECGINPIEGQKLLVQCPNNTSLEDKTLLQAERAATLKVQDSGIKLLVDLNISPEADADTDAASKRLPLLPKSCENGQITITESVNSGKDHQIRQITPLVSEVYNLAGTADLLALGKKTTRILQFDSPDKILAPEISSSSMASICQSFCSSVWELEEDEASEWSVIVHVSSPEGKHDEPELYGEDSADSIDSGDSTSSCFHENLQENRIASNKLDLLWSVRRKGTPFRKSTIEDDEEEEACDGFNSTDEEQNNSSWEGKSEQYPECESLCQHFCNLTFETEKGERKGLPRAEGKHIRFSYDSDDEHMTEHQEIQAKEPCREAPRSESVLLRGLPVATGIHLRFDEEAYEGTEREKIATNVSVNGKEAELGERCHNQGFEAGKDEAN